MNSSQSHWKKALEKARQAKRCGAKTRSTESKLPCQSPAMSNGRCRMHGGRSTGAPQGEAHGNYKKGHYTKVTQLQKQENSLFIKKCKAYLNLALWAKEEEIPVFLEEGQKLESFEEVTEYKKFVLDSALQGDISFKEGKYALKFCKKERKRLEEDQRTQRRLKRIEKKNLMVSLKTRDRVDLSSEDHMVFPTAKAIP